MGKWTKEKQREYWKEWYERNRERVREYDRKKYLRVKAERHEKQRIKKMEGKRCRLCGIDMTVPLHGGHGTRVHCTSCSRNKKAVNTERQRIYRKKKSGWMSYPQVSNILCDKYTA